MTASTDKHDGRPLSEIETDVMAPETHVPSEDDEFADAVAFMHGRQLDQNTASLSEFKRYLPLYRRSVIADKPTYDPVFAELERLCIEFEGRFTSTMPLTIVDDFDKTKVVCVFPPYRRAFKSLPDDSDSALNMFAAYADSARTDVRAKVASKLLLSIVKAQKFDDRDAIFAEKKQNAILEVTALRAIDPEHPIVKQFDAFMASQQSSEKPSSEEHDEQRVVIDFD